MSVSSSKRSDIHIRWMIRRDLPYVLNFDKSMSEETILPILRQRNCIATVADVNDGNNIAGYMIYELHKTYINLIHIIIDEQFRNQGIGTALINKMKSKLSQHRRRHLRVHSTKESILFFNKQDFYISDMYRPEMEDMPLEIAHDYMIDNEETIHDVQLAYTTEL